MLIEYAIQAQIITGLKHADIVKRQGLSAEVVRAILIKSGAENIMLIPFTSSDLVNGKLIKLHNLNRRIVEVAVTDGNGIEYQPGVNNLADNTRVEIDLTRFDIVGTWYLLIR